MQDSNANYERRAKSPWLGSSVTLKDRSWLLSGSWFRPVAQKEEMKLETFRILANGHSSKSTSADLTSKLQVFYQASTSSVFLTLASIDPLHFSNRQPPPQTPTKARSTSEPRILRSANDSTVALL